MLSIPFDVNDPNLRKRFLGQWLLEAVAVLEDSSRPAWGKMSAQQMIEHLTWAFELSNGNATTDCPVPSEQRRRVKAFFYSNAPTPREYANPVLAGGLPPLRHKNLEKARYALQVEAEGFLRQPLRTTPLRMHPIGGLLGPADWSRAHFKHAYHHLLQFRLLEERKPLDRA